MVGLGAGLAIVIVVAATFLLVRATAPEQRPVVLSIYCASSAAWVNTFAPFLDQPAPDDGEAARGRVTQDRIRAAYERRCAAPN